MFYLINSVDKALSGSVHLGLKQWWLMIISLDGATGTSAYTLANFGV